MTPPIPRAGPAEPRANQTAVTATAGLSLTATSRLYFATFDGEAATLQSLDLPTTVAGLRPASAALADQTQKIRDDKTKFEEASLRTRRS